MRSRITRGRASTLVPIGFAAALAACTSPPPAPIPVPPPIPARVAATTPVQVTPPAVSPLEGTSVDVPKYPTSGRRDPFEVFEVKEGGGGGLTVSSTRLTGIVRNSRSALALVEAPDGIGYILRPGDTLGDGKLMDIGLDNVVFAVTAKPGVPATRVVLRLLAN